MNTEIEQIKKIFGHYSINVFVKYYETFQKYCDLRSNEEIYAEFDKNNEDWTEKSKIGRASKGKTIFRKGLEIPALIYITNQANENKLDIETIPKALKILAEINEFEYENNRTTTEDIKKTAQVHVRNGQSNFRKRLIDYWQGSSIVNCKFDEVLVSSHIKPYKDCKTIEEKYDLFNGLLLTPNYDKLFDNHLISFNLQGNIMISKSINEADLKCLGINKNAIIKKEKFNEKHIEYLRHHNLNFNNKENKR